MKVTFNKTSNNNPFYGLKNCLQLYKNVDSSISPSLLTSCYKEVKDDKQKREMFFSLLFSIGDITNRKHNIFQGIQCDNGGNANREGFWNVFLWLKDNYYEQFIKFLNAGLFNEYTCFDFLFRSRVKTRRNTIIKVYDIFADKQYCQDLVEYLYKVINGNNPFNKHLVAKFLTPPRLGKRAGHKKMLPETYKVMQHKAEFLTLLSKTMGWECENFKGYRKWRQEYNQRLESVLFSTKQIFNFDKASFLYWVNTLPAQARFRVRKRLYFSEKYPQLQSWFREWEEFKEIKQAEQRELEEKVRQGQASEADKLQLEKVKKEAKVTVGATSFSDLYKDICRNTIDPLKLESFMNKVNLPYNSLVFIDDSGSMAGAPFAFASFLAAACLVKNPDDDGRNLLGFFNSKLHLHSYIDVQTSNTPNSILRRNVQHIEKKPFVDPTKSFYENYKTIASFCAAVYQSGCTYIDIIPDRLYNMCVENPSILDALKAYPVWTIISDTEWNSLPSPEASLNDFFVKCERYFGFRPFVIAIDTGDSYYSSSYLSKDIERFSGIENFMYIPGNLAMIEQFLTNFKDLDVMDVYTPLQSIFRSNRYEWVRQHTL